MMWSTVQKHSVCTQLSFNADHLQSHISAGTQASAQWSSGPSCESLIYLYSCFQTWPVGNVQRIGSKVYPEFSFHTRSRGLSTQTHSQKQQILSIIQARGGGAGCSRRKQEVTYYSRSNHIVFFTTHRHWCQLLSPDQICLLLVLSSLHLLRVNSIIRLPNSLFVSPCCVLTSTFILFIFIHISLLYSTTV